ncbi:hypothetical protein [Halomonas organivorans]|uniref:Uncharacterized protein n=1 Tax=Halomonas organivorans TaxID=257772 RepID=A0A7W5BXX2_9GAMM|nr:hypothetical protein [Halomonas organivorans]MBB3141191.1 hypothetical protein [Halomonas organivorans]
MRAWRRGTVWVVLAALLSGCGSSEEDSPPADERVGGVAQPEPTAEATPTAEVPPFDAVVVIEVSARLRSDRRLVVESTTNLPDHTRLQVLVEREVSGVRWQERTTVSAGAFSAGPFGPGSGLPDGDYRITVNMPPAQVQPPEVRARLGEQGENLRGPLVEASRHGLGQVVSASQRFLVGSRPRHTTDQVEVMELD